MSRYSAVAFVAVSFLACSSVCHGDGVEDLRRNPFEHPKLDAEAPNQRPTDGRLDDGTLRVRAIVVAGERSLVSVNGTILGIGEERFGYVLRSVEEEAAVFSRDGETLTISLFEQRTDEDGD